MKRTTRVRPDLCQDVTNRIIDQLESGVVPWHRPWHHYGPARNYATGHVYTGINAFLLNFLCPAPLPFYLTYKQAKDLGGQVRKGATAERIFFFTTLYKDENGKRISAKEAGQYNRAGQQVQYIPIPKTFAVFNIADVDGIDFDLPDTSAIPCEPITVCEELLIQLHDLPEIVHLDPTAAFYSPKRDTVNVPPLSLFESANHYYKILFHELTHGTGHASRLSRPGVLEIKAQDHPAYAQEELIAELGAAFLCHHARIDDPTTDEQSAAYIDGYLSCLRNDKRLIFRAAAAAQRAVDYLLVPPE